ncbi:hypothetical protein E2C01_049251 [Portunus trituberculatus]|uniref:Uncharacterized protein n=1 Tax=Portunus trituberculatus TaxID=210409 RepID=A0A5B7GCD4_PORTR|nr:hypothetical protein [Portunus trituberculatus]
MKHVDRKRTLRHLGMFLCGASRPHFVIFSRGEESFEAKKSWRGAMRLLVALTWPGLAFPSCLIPHCLRRKFFCTSHCVTPSFLLISECCVTSAGCVARIAQ